MKVLVTGGAGYIGSITCQELVKQGFEVIVYDNLSKGHRKSIENLKLIEGDTKDKDKLAQVLKQEKIQAVLHFAAFIEMGESMLKPYEYFYNNTYGSLQLLEAMTEAKVNKIVFSSTAGVYGNPVRLPIKEEDEKRPTNPYGESKLMVEKLLQWFNKVHKLGFISLRYFNASGAALDGSIGEDHHPESHLIPNLIKAALGKKSRFELFGNDYETADGTCIRDYIHVLDLASAHILALKALDKGLKSDFFNVGTARGYSNKQVIDMVKKVTGKDFEVKMGQRRPGDSDELVADSSKLQKELGWQPKYSDLKTIVESAYKWHSNKV